MTFRGRKPPSAIMVSSDRMRLRDHRLMTIQFQSGLALLVALFVPLSLIAQTTGHCFDDTHTDRVFVGNAYYELALSKQNGAVLGLSDKSTGASLTEGSRSGCLWGANVNFTGPNPSFVGGCSYQ